MKMLADEAKGVPTPAEKKAKTVESVELDADRLLEQKVADNKQLQDMLTKKVMSTKADEDDALRALALAMSRLDLAKPVVDGKVAMDGKKMMAALTASREKIR